jgi:Fur family ferric uptake transcriptional regulator
MIQWPPYIESSGLQRAGSRCGGQLTHKDGAQKRCYFLGTHMNQTNELKSSGLKVTLPRLKILELFQKNLPGAERHLSADDVYKILLGEQMDIGLATVYRVLTQFEQAGILVRRNFESGKALYELNEGEPHDHLLCVNCGQVEEFTDPQIYERQTEIAEKYGYVLHERAMSLYGLCATCQVKTKRR